MNVAEVPMTLFTVIAQMCVGAFITLGAIQVFSLGRYSTKAVDRLADPTLLAIGPAMVLGLAVSTLHMHDISNTLNVIRHFDSSWLSREIVFGMGFAGLGFLFAIIQWRKWGSPAMRRVVAVLTALVGVGLVWSMASIYHSLVTVPAWNSWFTYVQFFATTLLLGTLSVGSAMVVVTYLRQQRLARGHTITDDAGHTFLGAPNLTLTPADPATRAEVESLLGASIRGIVLAAIGTAAVLLVALPVYLSSLAQAGVAADHALEAYSGWTLAVRVLLLVLGTGLVALFAYILAGEVKNTRPLAAVMVLAFVLVLIGEFMGRSMFYESMMRVGV